MCTTILRTLPRSPLPERGPVTTFYESYLEDSVHEVTTSDGIIEKRIVPELRRRKITAESQVQNISADLYSVDNMISSGMDVPVSKPYFTHDFDSSDSILSAAVESIDSLGSEQSQEVEVTSTEISTTESTTTESTTTETSKTE